MMAHRQARVDTTPTGEPPAANCPALNGQCRYTDPGHHDHAGPAAAITTPHGSDTLLDAQILSFSETSGGNEIALALGWNAGGTELTAIEAHQLADQLDQFAAKLRTLAAELQHLNQN